MLPSAQAAEKMQESITWTVLQLARAMLTILVYQVAGTVHAAQSGFLQTTVLSSLFFIAWAEGYYHRVPSKLHDISIIQQYQVNDLSSRQDIRAEQQFFHCRWD